MSLSVTIATKNEEENIRDCLESVKWTDEIVVVDDVSNDRTVEIAKLYTSKVFIRGSKGDFHKNKNLAIEKASGDWILSLDADEVITPDLAYEIKEAINNEKMLGYYLNRKNFFLGKWIRRCGWYPNYIIRLFRKGATKWPLLVHATPQIVNKEQVGYLKNPFLHYSFTTLNQYIEKFNFYTSCLAKEEYIRGARLNKKNFFVCFLIKPTFLFLRKYIIWKGYRDGFAGLFISFASAWTIFMSYAKLWELQNKPK